jgi:hypothetical protein
MSSKTQSACIPIVVVERNGDLRAAHVESYNALELSKKCKHKTSKGFEVFAEWAYSGEDATDRFLVELWARDNGTAGQENKYEFPPPVDTMLFFGACALVAKDMSSQHRVIPLTLEKWDKMYDFLFGGFDTLANCDDDGECDELDSIPAHLKTKDGYLKDGFVVDSGEDDDDAEDDDDDEDEDDDDDDDDDVADADDDDEDPDDEDPDDDEGDRDDRPTATAAATKTKKQKPTPLVKRRDKKQMREEVLVDTSSELSEEAYEYCDD